MVDNDNDITYEQPRIVCLCGSTKFLNLFASVNANQTLLGHIVLSIACVTTNKGSEVTDKQKEDLDYLHMRKIDLADAVYIINKDGYMGFSTIREARYAHKMGKKFIWHEAPEEACLKLIEED